MKYIYITTALIIFIFSFSFNACYKTTDVEGEVELYLIESFETTDGFFKINESSVVTEDKPFIKYSELISYNSKKYYFEISESIRKNIKDSDQNLFSRAFAIKSNNKLVYTGYFWAGYSSQSVNWITIDILSTYYGDKLWVDLGYPGGFANDSVLDKRNDNQILDIFRRDNKLIE